MEGAIMQPTFIPWLGYFAMVDQVDLFIFLDSVQLEKRSWQVRNRIKYGGHEKMLTIPVAKMGGRASMRLDNTLMVEDGWRDRHLETVYHAYHKSRYFDEVFPIIADIYGKGIKIISNFTIELIQGICRYLGIRTPFKKSSELGSLTGKKDELLVEICKKCGINKYLSAYGSSAYIESGSVGGAFYKNGLALFYQNYEHPVYRQMEGEFIPYMGIIDLLFNYGGGSIEVIREGIRAEFAPEDILLR